MWLINYLEAFVSFSRELWNVNCFPRRKMNFESKRKFTINVQHRIYLQAINLENISRKSGQCETKIFKSFNGAKGKFMIRGCIARRRGASKTTSWRKQGKSQREWRKKESADFVFTDVKCKWQRVASKGRAEHPLERQTEYIPIEMVWGLCAAENEAECGRARRKRSQSFGHLDAFALKWLLAFA